jgi:hypothetical protein
MAVMQAHEEGAILIRALKFLEMTATFTHTH